jgi:hypothetical protein
VCSFVVIGRILKNIARAFGAAKLLALAKPFDGIQLIAIGKVLY